MKVHIILGIPGSGKTTLAKELQEKYPDLVRINKDDIRSMLWNGAYSPENEKLVRQTQESLIISALAAGNSIVLDDAGLLSPSTQKALAIVLERQGLSWSDTVETHWECLHVPLAECIRRDRIRPNGVGEAVIRKFASRYTDNPRLPHDPLKDTVYIMDIDGCLADMCDRDVFDWTQAHRDYIHQPMQRLMESYYYRSGNEPIKPIILTGRECTPENNGLNIIQKWFAHHGVEVLTGDIITRQEGDRRPSDAFKREHLESLLQKYNIGFLVDDDATVIDMATTLGIPTIKPNFLDKPVQTVYNTETSNQPS